MQYVKPDPIYLPALTSIQRNGFIPFPANVKGESRWCKLQIYSDGGIGVGSSDLFRLLVSSSCDGSSMGLLTGVGINFLSALVS